MRIGIDASNLREGGGVTHLVELLQAAVPSEHGVDRVTVWAGRETLAHLPERSWLEARTDPALDGCLPQRAYWQTRTLAREAATAADVLFVPGGTYRGAFRPFVAMFRNMLPFADRERRRYGLSAMRAKLELLQFTQASTFRRADGVIVLTDHAREVLSGLAVSPRQRIAVIPHGVDRSFLRPPRAQHGLETFSAERPLRLLYVSKVDLYKHQWTVAEAVAELRSEGLPIALRLVGPAYGPAASRPLATLDAIDPARHYVRYEAAVERRYLPDAYASADGFVFASTCENLPNILIEAMAAGLPIACSNRRPMPDVLGPDAFYFDPESRESIVAALRALVIDPEARNRAAEAAYARAQSFSWERCARETFAFVRETAGGAGRTACAHSVSHA